MKNLHKIIAQESEFIKAILWYITIEGNQYYPSKYVIVDENHLSRVFNDNSTIEYTLQYYSDILRNWIDAGRPDYDHKYQRKG